MENTLKDIQQAITELKSGKFDILTRVEGVEKDLDIVKKINRNIEKKYCESKVPASPCSDGLHNGGRAELNKSTKFASASASGGITGTTSHGNSVHRGDNFASVQDKYQSIKDKVSSVKIPQELRVGNSRAGIKREDSIAANIVSNSAKYVETTIPKIIY